MQKFNLTKQQKFEILKALNVDLTTVEKIWQPTLTSLVIQFIDGYVATFNIYKGRDFIKKYSS